MAVVFLLAQKGDAKMRQGFPLHSLRSASAMTLLMAEFFVSCIVEMCLLLFPRHRALI
jgi:hypothetical protein